MGDFLAALVNHIASLFSADSARRPHPVLVAAFSLLAVVALALLVYGLTQ